MLSGVDIVICTYTVPDLESGFGIHNILTTEVITCATVPYPRLEISKYSQKKDSWHEIPDVSLPSPICDASIVQVLDDIFVIGGFTLKNDVSRNLHYFEPQTSLWKLNLKTNKWCQGPDLPVLDDLIGFAKGTTYLLEDGCQIIYSGGVQLKINSNKNQVISKISAGILTFTEHSIPLQFPSSFKTFLLFNCILALNINASINKEEGRG